MIENTPSVISESCFYIVLVINSSSYGQTREVGLNASPLLYANSTIKSVTVSDWGNIFIHGTSNGEIHASYPNQVFQNVDLEKSIKMKKFVSDFFLAFSLNLNKI